MTRLEVSLFGLLSLLLLGLVGWSYIFMSHQQDAVHQGAEDLDECFRMVPLIENCGRLPMLAADQERIAGEITSLIEQAAKDSRISVGKSLVRINPEPAQRVGDSVYKEKPTQVLLRDVTLPQVVEMLHRMASSGQPLHAKSIRITAPKEEDMGPTWNAEVTVSYLIYEPIQVTEVGRTK